jgi:hypothetical protein
MRGYRAQANSLPRSVQGSTAVERGSTAVNKRRYRAKLHLYYYNLYTMSVLHTYIVYIYVYELYYVVSANNLPGCKQLADYA